MVDSAVAEGLKSMWAPMVADTLNGKRDLEGQNYTLTHITYGCSHYLTHSGATIFYYYYMDLSQIIKWSLLDSFSDWSHLFSLIPPFCFLTWFLINLFRFFFFAFCALNIRHILNLYLLNNWYYRSQKSWEWLYGHILYDCPCSSWLLMNAYQIWGLHPLKLLINSPIKTIKPHLYRLYLSPNIPLYPRLHTLLNVCHFYLRVTRISNNSFKNSYETKTYPFEYGRGTNSLEKEGVRAYSAVESIEVRTSVEAYGLNRAVSAGVYPRSAKSRMLISIWMLD